MYHCEIYVLGNIPILNSFSLYSDKMCHQASFGIGLKNHHQNWLALRSRSVLLLKFCDIKCIINTFYVTRYSGIHLQKYYIFVWLVYLCFHLFWDILCWWSWTPLVILILCFNANAVYFVIVNLIFHFCLSFLLKISEYWQTTCKSVYLFIRNILSLNVWVLTGNSTDDLWFLGVSKGFEC